MNKIMDNYIRNLSVFQDADPGTETVYGKLAFAVEFMKKLQVD